MKLFVPIILFFLFFATVGNAQTVNGVACKTRSFSFQCPTDSDVLLTGKSDKPFVAFDRKEKVGLFAQEIEDKSKDLKSIDKVFDKTFQTIFSTKISDFKIKDSKDFWGNQRYSKFEETKGSKVALNTKSLEFVHIHYAIIGFEGKRILVGFTRVMMKGAEAEARYNKWIGGGGSGDSELQNLIISITKETRPKEDVPGGPPPPKARPKP